MTPAARLSAAIEVIGAIDSQRVPAAKALKEWGTAHRFAGSGDRAAISGLVYDVLRRQASSAWIMDDDTPRARLLGMLRRERELDADAIATLCDGSRPKPRSAFPSWPLQTCVLTENPVGQQMQRRWSGRQRRLVDSSPNPRTRIILASSRQARGYQKIFSRRRRLASSQCESRGESLRTVASFLT